jgi:hypothetical protein
MGFEAAVGPLGNLNVLGTVGTILTLPNVQIVSVVGTVGTLVSGQVTASISGGNIPFVGTIGTLISLAASPISSGTLSVVATVGIMGTLIGTLATWPGYLQTNIKTNQGIVLTAASASIIVSTLLMGNYHEIGIDSFWSTLTVTGGTVGSILFSLQRLEPQTGQITAMLQQSGWAGGVSAGTVLSVGTVAGGVVLFSASIEVHTAAATVTGLYITATQKA